MTENEEEPSAPAPISEKSDEQVETEIRARIHQISVDVYMRTQDETNKRWIFEAEIKRPYFHVKPMDEPQLSNWRRYLDFEEEANDEHRVQVLYERCLVACVCILRSQALSVMRKSHSVIIVNICVYVYSLLFIGFTRRILASLWKVAPI